MIWIINVITPTVKCEMSSRFSSLSPENDLMLLSKIKLQARPGSNFFHYLKIWMESICHSNSSIQYRIIEVYNIVSDIDFPAWLVGLKWTDLKGQIRMAFYFDFVECCDCETCDTGAGGCLEHRIRD